MGRFLRRSLSATFALGLLFVSAPPQSVAAVDPYNATAQQTLINQDRAQNGGLPALAWNNCLANIAQQNADRIAAQGSLSHTNGPTLDLACVPGATYAGENIAFTSRGIDDAQVNTMFMNSAPHRANILGNYTLVATAWTVASNGYGYIAEEFLNAPAPVPDPFRAMFTLDAFGRVHGDGYILDGWGGLHQFAVGTNPMPPAITNNAFWPGWRIARDIALTPGSTASNVSGVTLDGYGGLHPFGTAANPQGGPYWANWNIARSVRLSPQSTAAQPQGWVLDGYGGLHPFGGAPSTSSGYYPSRDLSVQLIEG